MTPDAAREQNRNISLWSLHVPRSGAPQSHSIRRARTDTVKDLAPLADRSYDSRKALQGELADYLTKSVIGHFRIEQRPVNYGGPPMSGMPIKTPDDLVGVDFRGWRGRR